MCRAESAAAGKHRATNLFSDGERARPGRSERRPRRSQRVSWNRPVEASARLLFGARRAELHPGRARSPSLNREPGATPWIRRRKIIHSEGARQEPELDTDEAPMNLLFILSDGFGREFWFCGICSFPSGSGVLWRTFPRASPWAILFRAFSPNICALEEGSKLFRHLSKCPNSNRRR